MIDRKFILWNALLLLVVLIVYATSALLQRSKEAVVPEGSPVIHSAAQPLSPADPANRELAVRPRWHEGVSANPANREPISEQEIDRRNARSSRSGME